MINVAERTDNVKGLSSVLSEKSINSDHYTPRKFQSVAQIDLSEAERFLAILDPAGRFHFQTWDDIHKSTGKKQDTKLSITNKAEAVKLDDIKKVLIDKNNKGAGVGVCINECSGKRKDENVIRVRAVYVDRDKVSPSHPFVSGLKPHVINESSSGKFHGIWLVDDCTLGMFPRIQKALAKHFDGDTKVDTLGRALRIPGFVHRKDSPFTSRIVEINQGPAYSVQDIINSFDLDLSEPEPEQERPSFSTSKIFDCIAHNEVGDSIIYKTLVAGRFCYDYSVGQWFMWNGNYWEEDNLESHIDAIREVVEVYTDAANQLALDAEVAQKKGNVDLAKRLQKQESLIAKRIYALQCKKRQTNVVALSCPVGRDKSGLGITGNEWDQQLYMLPCENGVVNLRTGEFRPGTQGDFITQVAPHEWKGLDEPCPNIMRYLSEILVDENLNPDSETLRYLLHFLGMAITGDVKEQLFAIFWGAGRNGKSTLFELLNYTLGPFVRKMPGELVLKSGKPQGKDTASPSLMDLRGRRICWVNETDEGRRLDISLCKELAGADKISARQLYGKMTNFDPTHTLILSTNYAPKITADPDDPIWDRIVKIPFRLRFTNNPTKAHERQKDTKLLSKLKAEASGFLALLVRSALEYQALDRFTPSENITKATQDYRNEEDVVGRFLGDCCEPGSDKWVRARQLYDAYKEWCAANVVYALSEKMFSSKMAKRDEFKKETTVSKSYIYRGLGLKSDRQDTEKVDCAA